MPDMRKDAKEVTEEEKMEAHRRIVGGGDEPMEANIS